MPCFSPINVPKRGYVDLRIEVPCGQCVGCRLDRSRMWATRCMHEARLHDLKCFLTLTYADDRLPTTGSLVKSDLQKFIKRLRRQHAGELRYFACGEYGDTTLRPHYHLILFGCDFPDKRRHSRNAQGHDIFVSELLDKVWGLGHCWIGNVTFESAAYVARYCLKKVNGDRAEDHYQGRTPEFALMSLKPGIGAKWFDEFKDDVYPSDFCIVRGKRVTPPRFYDEKLKKLDVAQYEEIKRARRVSQRRHADNQTPERLAVRREVQESKIKTFLKRSI